MKIVQAVGALALVALSMFGMASCGINQRVTQTPNSAYLTFAGDPSGLVLQVNQGDLVPLQGSLGGTRYSVSSGKIRVRVTRGPSMIVDRQIYVGRGQGFLIELP